VNLGEIRDAIYAQADWEPNTSSDENTRVNGFINRACDQIALEAPFLFHESEVHFATQPDVIGEATDTVRFNRVDDTPTAGLNPYLLVRTTTVPAAVTAGFTTWLKDRSWDGRVVEIVDSDGTVYRNRIRTITTVAVGNDNFDAIVLWKPWPATARGTTSSTDLTYRIYTEHYYLPDEYIQLKSARLYEESFNWPLTVLGQDEAEMRSLADRRTTIAAGQPRALFRRATFRMDGPRVAPAAASSTAIDWTGPEPGGSFSYIVTYTWGKRDTEYRNPGAGFWDSSPLDNWDYSDTAANSNELWARNRSREPLWESAPSPISDTITVVGTPDNGVAADGVRVTLPNIEYMQGFAGAGTDVSHGAYSQDSNFLSGWHVRVYRRRHTEDFTNYHTQLSTVGREANSLHRMDIPDQYFLLAEVRIDSVNDGYFDDDGTIIPDYHRPLRETHGYQAIQLYPKPDQRYEVDVRCIRRPRKLVSDSDVPAMNVEAMDAIIHRALVLFYEHEGNHEKAAIAMSRYDRNLRTLTKRESDLRPPQLPYKKQFARVRSGAPNKSGIRRWWTTDV
jgi:hypothetical protein